MAETTDLVYGTSKWTRFLYSEQRDQIEALRKTEEQGQQRAERYPDFQREVFSRMFAPHGKPLEAPADGSAWAQKLHGLAGELPEFRSLQERCAGDEMWSGMATSTLSTTVLAKTLKEQRDNGNQQRDVERLQQRVELLEQLAEAEDGEGEASERLEKAEQQLQQAQQAAQEAADGIDPSTTRQALRAACARAREEIDETEAQLRALSYSSGPGQPGIAGDVAERKKLADKLASNSKIREIAKLAGRLRRTAMQKQREKTDDARSEISDIEQGSDLARLLPTELAALADGDGSIQETLLFAKIVERKALQYKLSGKEKAAEGPVVICVDVSGSMEGDRDTRAKATTLAIIDIAAKQNRTAGVVLFDGQVQRWYVFPKGKVDTDELLDMLGFFSGGGTSFQEPLDRAKDIINGNPLMVPHDKVDDREFSKADVMLITDGCCHVNAAWRDTFELWKKDKGVSLIAVRCNVMGAAYPVLPELADHFFELEELLANEERFNEVAFKI